MIELKTPPTSSIRKGPRSRRVLALAGDTQVGLWMVRDLGMHGLTVFSIVRSPLGQAAHSRYSKGVWLLEKGPKDPGFADEMLALARRLDVGSIILISEGYHLGMIGCRDRFEPEIKVFSPSAKCFGKATDKDYMNELATELGIPVARGCRLDHYMDDPSSQPLEFPLVLRARRQAAAGAAKPFPWKAAYAVNGQELAARHAEVADQADNVIVQEYHPGVEDHVQVLMHEGEAFMTGEYVGEHHMPLAGGVTVQRVTCRHPRLIDDAVRLLKALDWQGVAGVQYHWDPATGKYIFLEVNPRFIGGLPTVIMAGFSAPYLLWQSHFEPEKMVRPRYRLGYRTRILGGDANWLLGMLRRDPLPPDQQHVGRLAAVAQFLWNTGPWTHDDVFLPGDPKPLWADLKGMVRRLGSRSVDIVGNN